MEIKRGLTKAVAIGTLFALGAAAGCAAEERKSCHIEVKAVEDGYDATAVVNSGTFPAGTVFTGHAKYRAKMKDAWQDHTPPDFTVPMGDTVHLASPINNPEDAGVKMDLASVQGVLDPEPEETMSVRTDCGTVLTSEQK